MLSLWSQIGTHIGSTQVEAVEAVDTLLNFLIQKPSKLCKQKMMGIYLFIVYSQVEKNI